MVGGMATATHWVTIDMAKHWRGDLAFINKKITMNKQLCAMLHQAHAQNAWCMAAYPWSIPPQLRSGHLEGDSTWPHSPPDCYKPLPTGILCSSIFQVQTSIHNKAQLRQDALTADQETPSLFFLSPGSCLIIRSHPTTSDTSDQFRYIKLNCCPIGIACQPCKHQMTHARL